MGIRFFVVVGSLVGLYLLISFLLSRAQKRAAESELAAFGAEEGLDEASINEIAATCERKRAEVKKAVRIGIVWVNLPILPGPLAATSTRWSCNGKRRVPVSSGLAAIFRAHGVRDAMMQMHHVACP